MANGIPTQTVRGKTIRVYDRKTWCLYDTGAVTTGVISELEFFKQPIGQGTSSIFGTGSKTITDTNMTDTTLNKGEVMKVQYVSTYIGIVNGASGIPPTDALLPTVNDLLLIQNGILEITRANNAVAIQVPLHKLPNGGGIASSTQVAALPAAVANRTNISVGNGAPFADAKYSLRENPIMIRGQQNFGVKIRWGSSIDIASASAMFIQVALEGVLWKEAL